MTHNLVLDTITKTWNSIKTNSNSINPLCPLFACPYMMFVGINISSLCLVDTYNNPYILYFKHICIHVPSTLKSFKNFMVRHTLYDDIYPCYTLYIFLLGVGSVSSTHATGIGIELSPLYVHYGYFP